MRKAFIALACAGSLFFAFAHGGGVGGFNTEDAGIVGNRELEITLTGDMDIAYNEDASVGTGLGLAYGVGGRFQIGVDNSWSVHKSDLKDYAFSTPEFSLKFAVIPQIFAIKTYTASGANRTIFGGDLVYTLNLPSETALSFNAGFKSDQRTAFKSWRNVNGSWVEVEPTFGRNLSVNRRESFTYAFSAIQNFDHFFVGAELFGVAYKDIDDDAKKPEWQFGLGYDFHALTVSLGFGGSFVCSDDLALSLGFTFNVGRN